MAYKARYRFRFESVNKADVTVTIFEDGYTGQTLDRCVGGSVTLRMESGGAVRGSSLEFPAECVVEDEFADLYTTDPYRFPVEVERNGEVIWRGLITPELYSAPWIDPPYDVTVTATDGLGELKLHTLPDLGEQSLEATVSTILGVTGITMPVAMVSRAVTDVTADPAYLLQETRVDMGVLAGKTYYEALEAILGALNATIHQRGGSWLIVRETDITDSTSGGGVIDTRGQEHLPVTFGSMRSEAVWPVGRLTSEIVPAKARVTVEAANEYADSLLPDPEMTGAWGLSGATHYSSDNGYYWIAPQQEIWSDFIPAGDTPADQWPDLKLTVRARAMNGAQPSWMLVGVEAVGVSLETGNQITLVYSRTADAGNLGPGEVTEGSLEWTEDGSYVGFTVPPAAAGNSQDCSEYVIPIRTVELVSNRMYPVSRVRIYVSSAFGVVCVHHASLSASAIYEKVTTRLVLGNGARGEAQTVTPFLADTWDGNKGFPFLRNRTLGRHGQTSYGVATWATDALPALPYGEWLAKDAALGVAVPRLRLRGVLNVPATMGFPPLVWETGGLSYTADDWALDLLNDEIDITLTTLPAAALQSVSVYRTLLRPDGEETGSVTTVLPSALNVPATGTGGYAYLAVSASGAWYVTGVPSWMTVDTQSGTGSGTVGISVPANSGAARQSVINVAGVPVAVTQASGISSHALTVNVSPASAQVFVTVTVNGVSEVYSQGMQVTDGATVGIRISGTGYTTVTDSFTMPAADTVKNYTVVTDIRATASAATSAPAAGGNLPVTVSDPSGHGWTIDFGPAKYYNYVSGAGVTSGSASVQGDGIYGTGDASVYLTVTANNRSYARYFGGQGSSAIYFYDNSRGTSDLQYIEVEQLGTGDTNIPVTSVTLDKSSMTLTEGATGTLAATVAPSNATDKTVYWTSSRASIASVSQDGVVTAKSAGNCVITCTANDGSGERDSCSVTVTSNVVAVTGVTLDRDSVTMAQGGMVTLTATVTPAAATDRNVSWSTSDSSVATVSTAGRVTAAGPGTATITVTTHDGGHTATCAVTVTGTGTLWATDISTASAATTAATDVTAINIDLTTLTATCGASWVTGVSVISGPRVRLTMTSNTATTDRSTIVTMTATDDSGNTVTASFRLTQRGATSSDVPCTEMTVNGPDSVENSGNTAEYSVSLTPAATTQKAVTWSVTDAFGDPTSWVTLTPDGLGCVLTVNEGADGNIVIVKAVNQYNASVTAQRAVEVTYVDDSPVTPPEPGHDPATLTVSPASSTVAPTETSDDTVTVSGTNLDGPAFVRSFSGFITSATVTNGKIVIGFPTNPLHESLDGSVTVEADGLGGDTVRAVAQYTQAAMPRPEDYYNFAILALRVEQVGGKVALGFKVAFRNNQVIDSTFYALAWSLTGYDSGGTSVLTKSGQLGNRTVSALSTETDTYTTQWSGVIGNVVTYELTLEDQAGRTDTYTGDGDDDIDD